MMKFSLTLVLATVLCGCSQPKTEPDATTEAGSTDAVKPFGDGVNPIGINVSIMAPPALHKSPEEAFDAFVVAVEEDQLRIAADIMSPATQTAVAGSMAFRLSLSAAAANYQSDKVAKLFEIHGLNDGNAKAAEDNGAASMMRSIGETVRYRSVFIHRAIQLLRDMEQDEGDFFAVGTLENLEVTENAATATLVIDEQTSRPVHFECRGGAWLIHIPDQIYEQ
ncbi:MAG: hypothetical protein NXI04_28015 [Planctomycetaceae bacterium]|nr:hypothetical protein [Planctomycetaceae bacterium]